jgi:hypothetical protein
MAESDGQRGRVEGEREGGERGEEGKDARVIRPCRSRRGVEKQTRKRGQLHSTVFCMSGKCSVVIDQRPSPPFFKSKATELLTF